MTRPLRGPSDHVVVVGAGLAGLSAALHLLGAGRRVTVVERDAGPGGRAGRLVRGGYRIDTGPTVLTMPEIADEAFAAVGAGLRDRVDLVPLRPAYRALFADGSRLEVHTDADAMEAEVERFAGPAEAAGYRRLRHWLTALHRAERHRFLDADFDSPWRLLGPDLLRLAALGGFGRWDAAVARHLRDERLRRVFTFQALYAGVPPTRALAAYAVIAYMDTVSGVYFPRGGMHALPRAMAGAAEEAGAVLHYGEGATRLERSGDRITAVVTDRRRIPCDAVVLTPDLPAAYRLLGRRPRRPVPLRHAPSAVVLHAGCDRTWPQLAHHTLSFGHAWRRTFHELTRTGELMRDPSLLITRPTATDPGLAPPGRHLHYVLAPCPHTGIGPDAAAWRDLGPRYRDALLRELDRRGLTGIAAAIEEECLVTPADWTARGHPAGTPLSAAHTLAQTGPFRPRNLVRGTANAVLAGCGTTPGVGVPPVLLSGKLAAARITGAGRTPAPPRAAPRRPAPAPAGGPGVTTAAPRPPPRSGTRPAPPRPPGPPTSRPTAPASPPRRDEVSAPSSPDRRSPSATAPPPPPGGTRPAPPPPSPRPRPVPAPPSARTPHRKAPPMTARELDAAGITDPDLRAAYTRCRELNARHGRTYFLATRLLTPDRRPAVHALYGFARWADDIVDSPGDEEDDAPTGRTARALDRLDDDLARGLAGGAGAEPVVRALADTARRHAIDHRLFTDFLASMRADLTVASYATYADLRAYMHGSAAVIGLQMLPVLGTVTPREQAEPHAAELGVAFQLTNFLRDVGEDLDRGRVYLPQDLLRAHGVNRGLLRHCRETGRADHRVTAALREFASLTRAAYRRAAPGIALLDPVSRPCVRTASVLYGGIVDAVAATGYAVLDRRAVVPRRRRALVAADGALRVAAARAARHAPGGPPAPAGRRPARLTPRPGEAA